VLTRKNQDACCKVLLRAAAEALLSPAGAGRVPAGALPGRHARSGGRPRARLHALRRRREGVHRAQVGSCAAAASCMHEGKCYQCQHMHITTPADWCMGTLWMSGARALPGARSMHAVFWLSVSCKGSSRAAQLHGLDLSCVTEPGRRFWQSYGTACKHHA